MAFTFSRSAGSVHEPAVVNMFASGVVRPGMGVEFLRTGGAGVSPAGANTGATTLFGVSLDYVQGASDALVRVIPFVPGQLWVVDCTDVALTAQIGLRHAINASGTEVRNTSSDVTNGKGTFLALAMTGLTTGSGKLIGQFISTPLSPAVQTGTVIYS